MGLASKYRLTTLCHNKGYAPLGPHGGGRPTARSFSGDVSCGGTACAGRLGTAAGLGLGLRLRLACSSTASGLRPTRTATKATAWWCTPVVQREPGYVLCRSSSGHGHSSWTYCSSRLVECVPSTSHEFLRTRFRACHTLRASARSLCDPHGTYASILARLCTTSGLRLRACSTHQRRGCRCAGQCRLRPLRPLHATLI